MRTRRRLGHQKGPVAEGRVEGSWAGLIEMEVSLLKCVQLCRLVPLKERLHQREMRCLGCRGTLEKVV